METLIAFHGKAAVKKKYVARVQAHQKADEIVQGFYWAGGKGCAVGCTIEGNEHARYETELGIPRIIARLEDRIFEGLTNGKAKAFPLKFLSAIKVGADLSLVWPKFAVWLLVDKTNGVIKHAKTDEQRKVITDVANLYRRVIKGETVDVNTWIAARRAADASAYAADASASADAAYASASAYAADASADASAYAADASADASADAAYARTKHYEKMASKLIALLKAAPIKKSK
jgi:hypothetical protein